MKQWISLGLLWDYVPDFDRLFDAKKVLFEQIQNSIELLFYGLRYETVDGFDIASLDYILFSNSLYCIFISKHIRKKSLSRETWFSFSGKRFEAHSAHSNFSFILSAINTYNCSRFFFSFQLACFVDNQGILIFQFLYHSLYSEVIISFFSWRALCSVKEFQRCAFLYHSLY